jgi:cell division protein FtsQ
MSLIRKNRKRITREERRSTVTAFFRGLGRAVLHVCVVLFVGALVAVGGLATYRWAMKAEIFSLQAITVQGLQHMSEPEVIKLSGLSLGQNMFQLNMANVERALGSNPWISAAKVRRRIPSTVAISLQEHSPAALAALGDLYLINEGGAPFKKLQAGDSLDLPLITGLSREQYLAAPSEGAARLRQAIAAGRLYLRSAPSDEPLSEVRLHEDGLRLIVGDGKEICLNEAVTERHFERLARVRSELDRRGLTAAVIHLDNRVRPGWITVKLAPILSERRGER